VEYTPTFDAETSLPVQGARRDNVVVIVERWENLAHLEAHLIAPHMMEYRPKVREFISRVGLQILEPAV
jgi:quinol monooxygenase YgiN